MNLDNCGACDGKPLAYEVNGRYYVSCSRCDSGHHRSYREYELSCTEWNRVQKLIREQES